MFYQVTAERIVTSFLFALLLRPFILHVAPVSGPNHGSKQIRENAAIDPYGLRVKVEFVIPVEKEKEKKNKIKREEIPAAVGSQKARVRSHSDFWPSAPSKAGSRSDVTLWKF